MYCTVLYCTVYRYCCVFYSSWLLSPSSKRKLERLILLYVTGERERQTDRQRERDRQTKRERD